MNAVLQKDAEKSSAQNKKGMTKSGKEIYFMQPFYLFIHLFLRTAILINSCKIFIEIYFRFLYDLLI